MTLLAQQVSWQLPTWAAVLIMVVGLIVFIFVIRATLADGDNSPDRPKPPSPAPMDPHSRKLNLPKKHKEEQ